MLSRPQKLSWLMALLAAFSFTVPVFADDELSAMAWLDRMSHSFRELSYIGVFSYQRGEQMESFRIAHAVFNDEEYERLEYLDGEPREIVRRGHSLRCMHPGHRLVRIYPQQQTPGRDHSNSALVGVDRYYQFAVAGEDRVAGRDVVEIAVMPLDAYRFGYALALDKETGLLLRSSLLGPGGEVIERFQFVEVTIGAQIPIALFESGEHSYQAGHRKATGAKEPGSSLSKETSWQVNWLPVGFTSTGSNPPLNHSDMRTFTDGMTVFSVFVEVADDINAGAEGRAHHGATTAYSRGLLTGDRPYRITVVGEIPAITAKKVAKSVTLANI